MKKQVTIAALMLAVAFVARSQPPVLRGMVEIAARPSTDPLAEIPADVLFVPVFDDEDPSTTVLRGLPASLLEAVGTARGQGALDGSLYESVAFYNPAGLAAKRLVLMGLGEGDELDSEGLRRFAGAALRSVRNEDVTEAAIYLRGSVPSPEAAQAVVEGAILGLFDAGLHKSDQKARALTSLVVAGVEDARRAESAIAKGTLMAHATNMARSLTVEPANYVTPVILAAHAEAIAREGDLKLRVFDETEIRDKNMGGVTAVGKGSANPPRFIDLRYEPATPSDVTIAFVGKGVCFDSGGISLKDGSGMYRMKGDMAGGATVLAVMQIVSQLKPAVNVMGIVPAVENTPGPKAQKPGDVFVGLSGKTVEVMSTDAEGRLILSDGVSYAVSEGATHVVDIATLTGTVRRALGDRHVGAFASDDRLFEKLQAAATRTGESFWRLPIDEDYARGIKDSLVADLNETGGDAGASIGAKFIQQFTEGKPWIHLDIAGLSWPRYTPTYRGAGPTGVTVRTLAEMTLLLGGASSDR